MTTIEEIREALAKATPDLPWRAAYDDRADDEQWVVTNSIGTFLAMYLREEDARAIVLLRNNIDALLAVAEAARAINDPTLYDSASRTMDAIGRLDEALAALETPQGAAE